MTCRWNEPRSSAWPSRPRSCALLAASYPDRVGRLILYTPWKRGVSDERERDEELARIRSGQESWGHRDALEQFARDLNPQWAEDQEYLTWFVWHHRLTASPAAWVDFRRMNIELDIAAVLPTIRVPTLVIAKEFMRDSSEEVAAAIPGAEYVFVPGVDAAFRRERVRRRSRRGVPRG